MQPEISPKTSKVDRSTATQSLSVGELLAEMMSLLDQETWSASQRASAERDRAALTEGRCLDTRASIQRSGKAGTS